MITTLVTAVHIFVCAMLILIVLLQQGKGADMGATFGGGGNTLFGASGADNLLTKVTTVTAFIFMCTCVYLAWSMKPGVSNQGNIFQSIPDAPPQQPVAPLGVPPLETTGSAEQATGSAAATQPVTTSNAPVDNASAGSQLPSGSPIASDSGPLAQEVVPGKEVAPESKNAVAPSANPVAVNPGAVNPVAANPIAANPIAAEPRAKEATANKPSESGQAPEAQPK